MLKKFIVKKIKIILVFKNIVLKKFSVKNTKNIVVKKFSVKKFFKDVKTYQC